MNTLSATTAMTSTSSPSVRPAARAASNSAVVTSPRLSFSAFAKATTAAARACPEPPRRLSAISSFVRPAWRPMAVCAETQYWQALPSATASAMRSCVALSRAKPEAAP